MKTPHRMRLISVISLCLSKGITSAAPGDLDLTFGSGGKVMADVGEDVPFA